MRPPPQSPPRNQISYAIMLLPYTRPEEVDPPPAEMSIQAHDVDEADWQSFLNHLFPYNSSMASSRTEKHQMQQEPEEVRCKRLKLIVQEWNQGFFVPRAVRIILQTEQASTPKPVVPGKRNKELGKALYEVVKKQDVATVRLLISHGADPDYRPTCATPAVVEATKRGNEEILKMLLDAGVNMEATAPCAETALFTAISKEKPKLLRLLLSYGAKINGSQPSGGEPPLYLACRKEYGDIVDILLESDVDLEAKPPGGPTPLYKCVEKEYTKTVRKLVNKGADVSATPPGGAPALYRAVEKEYTEIARLLVEHGAKIEASPPGGHSALCEAVRKENREMVRLLLEYGADPHGVGRGGGESPVIKASKKGYTKILEVLLEAAALRQSGTSANT